MHAQMKHMVSIADLMPTLARVCVAYNNIMLAKVRIKSCRFDRECVSFVHAWM